MKVLKKSGIMLILLFCFLLSGCSPAEADDCKGVVEDFLTAYHALDQTAGQYLKPQIEELKFQGVQAALAKRMNFSVKRVKKQDDRFMVKTMISTVDFKAAIEKVSETITEADSTEKVMEALRKELCSESTRIRDFSLEIPVKKCEDGYRLILTAELSNALFGGYNEYLTELTGGMLNG